MRRGLWAGALLLALGQPGAAQEIRRTVGQLSLTADPSWAFPGGLLVVRLRRALGTTYAMLLGRRVPFFESRRGPLALVPIPVDAASGTATLGIELWARSGRQRVAVDNVPIAPRSYAAQPRELSEATRALLGQADAVIDGRRLLQAIRTVTPQAQWSGNFAAPLDVPPKASFGVAEPSGTKIDWITDGVYGEYHRGIDYESPPGTVAVAPAAGTVVLASPLALSGWTVVLDHGMGVTSALLHLGRIEVHEGDRLEARAAIGLTGDSGTPTPRLEWRVYVHGVAVDPAIFQRLAE